MPKKNRKKNQREVDDDFDEMLSTFRAGNFAKASLSQVAQSAYGTTTNTAKTQAPKERVSEATILAAIEAGDLTRLRRWHRLGVQFPPILMCMAASRCSIPIMSCIVKELGADVNEANDNGATPLVIASMNGDLNLVRCLLKELGAQVNQGVNDGSTAIMFAAQKGHLAVVRCLGREHGADVNSADVHGTTALILAAQDGHLEVVQCLVGELGAFINLATHDGRTALMMASLAQHDKIIRWLTRNGSDAQASTVNGTVADFSRAGGAPIAQTEYLEAKAHCSNTGCSGAGLKKCTGCKQARYCGQTCQLAHWNAHKAECNASK
jgi:ankyrin repeat protein